MRIELDGIIYGLQRRGGISTYWTQLCLGLAHDPAIALALRLPRRRLGADLARIEALGTSIDMLPTALARYLPCRCAPGSLFHSPYYRIGLGRDVRRVLTVHDFAYERYRSGAARLAHAVQKRAAIARADAVLCVSRHTRDELLHFHPRFDRDRLFVIPHAYDPATFFADPKIALVEQALFVGLRGGYKRFDLAIEAVCATARLRLAIVGPPLAAAERQRLHDRLGDRWRYLGPLDDDGLRRAYAASVALLYPSDHEGFGLPVLEAMACGTAVVTNRGSALGEVGGDAAFYSAAQSADGYAAALARACDAGLRRAHIARGLAWSRTFRWANTIALTKQAYAVLGSDRSSASH